MDEILFITFGSNIGVRRLMDITDPCAGLYFCKSSLLRVEDDLINLTLPGRELTGDRVRSRDVAAVAAVFGANIDNDQITGLHATLALVVVKNRRKRAGTHNGWKSRAFGSIASEFILQRCLDLIFHHAWSNTERGSLLSFKTNIHCF